jgi:hypothetical protein
LEDQSVDERIILKLILKIRGLMILTGLNWPKIVVGSCGIGNEISGSIKTGRILTSCATVSFSRMILFHVVGV